MCYREGLVSIPGYVAIYLAGVSVGFHLVKNVNTTYGSYLQEMKRVGM